MPYTKDEPNVIPKVYKVLLTQTLVSTTSGLLVVGKTYNITSILGTDDFANVGYVSPGVDFVATGTTPTTWTNLTVVVNQTDSAPIATVLVNTLSGIPVWSRNGVGDYLLTLVGEFTQTKRDIKFGILWNADGINGSIKESDTAVSDDYINILGYDAGGLPTDGLTKRTITIEVYP